MIKTVLGDDNDDDDYIYFKLKVNASFSFQTVMWARAMLCDYC